MTVEALKKIRKENKVLLRKSVPKSALLSEKTFAKTWLNEEEDEAWKDL